MTDSSSFGQLLRRYRLAARLTQEELAERAGLSARAISDHERGIKQRPYPTTVRMLADALGISPVERAILTSSTRQSPTSASRSGRSQPLYSLPIGGFLGALPVGPLVAREPELARIVAAIDGLERGQSSLTLLAGEPGIGKTRLAQETALILADREFLTLIGRCYGTERDIPYYPFLEALGAAWPAVPHDVRAEISSHLPHLHRLLPEEGSPIPDISGAGQEERDRLMRAVAALLQALAARVPVALLLDDLQWADRSSLDLLRHLVHFTQGTRVFLFGTYRDVEMEPAHPLQAAIVDLRRDQLVEVVTLVPLSRTGTRALIEATLDDVDISDRLADLVYQRTDGNAFFVQAVLRELDGSIAGEGNRGRRLVVDDIEVPDTVRTLIVHRLSSLGSAGRRIAFRASVLGQAFGFDDLLAAGDDTEDEVEEGLEEAKRAGLIRSTGRDAYAFSHALTHQAIYDELATHRRRRLHLAAGLALERLPERSRRHRAGEIARHLLEGGHVEGALVYTLLAGDQAEGVFAQAEAERFYRRALQLARELDGAQLGEALFKLGTHLLATGHHDEALALMQEARQQFQTVGNLIRECNSVGVIAQIYAHLGQADRRTAAISCFERLLDSIDAASIPPSPNVVIMYIKLAIHHVYIGGACERAVQAAEHAVTAAGALGDRDLLTEAELGRATALGRLGHIKDAFHIAQGIIPGAEGAGNLTNLETALGIAAEFLMWSGRFGESRLHRERQLDIAQKRDLRDTMPWTLSNLAQVALYQGEWQVARHHAERARTIAQSTGSALRMIDPLLRLGELALYQGRWEEASKHLEDCLAMADHLDAWQLTLQSARALAERDRLNGDADAVRWRLEPLMSKYDSNTLDVAHLAPILAWAYWQLGQLEEAAELAATSIERAEAEENRLTLVDALWVQGLILSEEQPEAAGRSLEGAIFLARSMSYPYAEARALYERGQLHASEGKLAPARECLEGALRLFKRIGATADVKRVEQELPALRL